MSTEEIVARLDEARKRAWGRGDVSLAQLLEDAANRLERQRRILNKASAKIAADEATIKSLWERAR
jgi:hypothetical protein